MPFTSKGTFRADPIFESPRATERQRVRALPGGMWLLGAGYDTLEKVREADDDALLSVYKVGVGKVRIIRQMVGYPSERVACPHCGGTGRVIAERGVGDRPAQ